MLGSAAGPLTRVYAQAGRSPRRLAGHDEYFQRVREAGAPRWPTHAGASPGGANSGRRGASHPLLASMQDPVQWCVGQGVPDASNRRPARRRSSCIDARRHPVNGAPQGLPREEAVRHSTVAVASMQGAAQLDVPREHAESLGASHPRFASMQDVAQRPVRDHQCERPAAPTLHQSRRHGPIGAAW